MVDRDADAGLTPGPGSALGIGSGATRRIGSGPARRPGPTGGLDVVDLAVKYGQTMAVAGVSLTVAPGEILALLGPSGSGKSTLLRAVAGLEPLVSGSVKYDGFDVSTTAVHRRGFGLMFQDGQLFAHRNVGGNVSYGIAQLPASQREQRTAEMLNLVGLSGRPHRSITTLSGGQAQRVALARALAPSPRLMLLDEPLSALDRQLRERLAADIRSILKIAKSPSIYVTHDQDEAFLVADRIAILIDGEVARIGTPTEIWSDPRRCDVAEFLGYRPILDTEWGRRAIAPGALRATPPGTESSGLEKGPSYPVIVTDVRMRRGYLDLAVVLAGQPAFARLELTTDRAIDPAGSPDPVTVGRVAAGSSAVGRLDPARLVGQSLTVTVELADCPVVGPAQ